MVSGVAAISTHHCTSHCSYLKLFARLISADMSKSHQIGLTAQNSTNYRLALQATRYYVTCGWITTTREGSVAMLLCQMGCKWSGDLEILLGCVGLDSLPCLPVASPATRPCLLALIWTQHAR